MQKRVGVYWHLFPEYAQGRKAIWEGIQSDGRKFLDFFPPDLVKRKNSTYQFIELTNGSIYQIVGSNNYNSIVGPNPVGVILSEYALQDPSARDYIAPMLKLNKGWAIYIYTMRGKTHGWERYQIAQKSDRWFCEFLVGGDEGTKMDDGNPVISDQEIQEEIEDGMSPARAKQEYYNDPNAPMEHAFYLTQLDNMYEEKRIGTLIWNPRQPVFTSWDIGHDGTVIWYAQENQWGGLDFIDLDHGKSKPFEEYLAPLKNRSYIYGGHYAPWDAIFGDKYIGDSRIKIAEDHGVKFFKAKRCSHEAGVDSTRRFMRKCRINDEKCQRGLDGLREYVREYDSVNMVYSDKYIHNWASHFAKAFELICHSYDNGLTIPKGDTDIMVNTRFNLFKTPQSQPQDKYNGRHISSKDCYSVGS